MMKKVLDWLAPYYNDIPSAKQSVLNYVSKVDGEVCKDLKMLYLYITFDCNQRCQYCWIHNNIYNSNFKMSTHMIEELLDEAIKLGLKKVKITGGEPFTYPNLNEIVNTILSRGLEVDIETNGTLISQNWINSIMESKKLFFKISLDSISSYIHDNLADSEVFQKTINGVKLLANNSIRFGLVTVLNRLNIRQFEEIVDFAFNLGASTHRIILSIQPLGRGKNINSIKLNLDETLDFINRFYSLEKYHDKILKGELHSTIPPAFMPLDNFNFKACNWGIGLCGIMPNGDVTLCSPAFEEMDLIAGNIFEKGLSNIWFNSDMFNKRNISPQLDGVCGKCLYANFCRGMCRIFAKATYGSSNAPYPFCQEMYDVGLFPEWILK